MTKRKKNTSKCRERTYNNAFDCICVDKYMWVCYNLLYVIEHITFGGRYGEKELRE